MQKYGPEIFREIIKELAETGKSIKSICESDPRFPTDRTFWGRIAEDKELFQYYVRAQEISQEIEDQALGDIADRILSGTLDPQAGRAAADILKWRMSKKAAKRFGDRLEIESKTEDTFTVQLIDYTGGKSSKTITIAEPQKQISDYSPV